MYIDQYMYLTRWFCLQDSKMSFITQKINQHLFVTLHVSKNYANLLMCICIEGICNSLQIPCMLQKDI